MKLRNEMRSFCLLAVILFSWPSLSHAAEDSLYLLPDFKDKTWKTDQDQVVSLANWQGKSVILTMAYTSCHSSCPMILQKLKKIQLEIEKRKLDTQVVIASFDWQKDTPTFMKNYREQASFGYPNWTFVVGNESNTRKLAMILGIKFSKNAKSGEILHDNKILMLDPQGKVQKELNGLNADILDLFR
jgi:protein SCO1/2